MKSLHEKLINKRYHPKHLESKDDLSKYLALSALEIAKGEVTGIKIFSATEAFEGETEIPTSKSLLIGYKKYSKKDGKIYLDSFETEIFNTETKETYERMIYLKGLN